MAEHVEPSMKYLQKFTSPLWDLIDLENYKPVSIIEAQRAGFDVVIIDMQHRAYGLMADNGQTANTTSLYCAISLRTGSRKLPISGGSDNMTHGYRFQLIPKLFIWRSRLNKSGRASGKRYCKSWQRLPLS